MIEIKSKIVDFDPVVAGFAKIIRENPKEKESVLFGMIRNMISKEQGRMNEPWTEAPLNFYICLKTLGKRVFDFVCSNIPGPNERTVRKLLALGIFSDNLSKTCNNRIEFNDF